MNFPAAFVSSFASGAPALKTSSFCKTRPIFGSEPKAPNGVPQRAPKMLFSFFNPEVVDIPQNDTANDRKRANNVSANRNAYKWTQKGIANASMPDGLPIPRELPVIGWVASLAPTVINILLNLKLVAGVEFVQAQFEAARDINNLVATMATKMLSLSFSENDMMDIMQALFKILEIESLDLGDVKNVDTYRELFRSIPVDKVAEANQVFQDDIFGWYRVAGPNPMRLKKLTGTVSDMFPALTDEIVQGIPMFAGDSLAAMAAENRLYFVEYPEFDGIKPGEKFIAQTKQGYIYAPTCLLAVPRTPDGRTTVLPLAVRCEQNPSAPMFTANPDHTNNPTWLAAKLAVQVSDALLHESVYHLGRTHLMTGLFLCATYRSLPFQHPIHRLLKCHFYGTTFINWAAIYFLVNTGGFIDNITAPSIEWIRQISADGVHAESFKYNDWFPDVELESRGVMDPNLKYPYRDDALEHWNALLSFVRTFITAYYKSDSDVQNDPELAAWCKEIVDSDKGNLHGFGDAGDGKIMSVEYLARVVALVIFTASVQHAAVNYPQSRLMQFPIGMPLGGYGPAPEANGAYASQDDFVKTMGPNMLDSLNQMTVAEAIGVMVYGTYGDYGRELAFAPEEVDEAMLKFQGDLASIGARIASRNQTERAAGLPQYNYLVPKNVPPSINI